MKGQRALAGKHSGPEMAGRTRRIQIYEIETPFFSPPSTRNHGTGRWEKSKATLQTDELLGTG